jgi:hypothetical protein
MTSNDTEGPARWSTRPGAGPSLCVACGEKPPDPRRRLCADCHNASEAEARRARKASLRARPCAVEGCTEPRHETASQVISYCAGHRNARSRLGSYVEPPVAPDGMWWCQSCEMFRPEADFHTRGDTGRLAHTCKSCKLTKATLLRDDVDRRERLNASARWSQIKQKYGLDRKGFLALLAKQGGLCGVCRKPLDPVVLRSIHVDHDHACCPTTRTCGKCVRGLLCDTCNPRLHAGIDLHWMLQAIAYLDLDRTP